LARGILTRYLASAQALIPWCPALIPRKQQSSQLLTATRSPGSPGRSTTALPARRISASSLAASTSTSTCSDWKARSDAAPAPAFAGSKERPVVDRFQKRWPLTYTRMFRSRLVLRRLRQVEYGGFGSREKRMSAPTTPTTERQWPADVLAFATTSQVAPYL